MKNLKLFMTSFLMIIISVLAGCSDQITSSGETGSSEKGEEVISSSSLPIGLPVVRTFRTQVRVKPHRSYTFDVLSTGYDRFYSIDINNLSLDPDADRNITGCEDISVYNKKEGILLSCHSNGFEISEITVENTGSKFLDLDVSLRAIKQKKEIKLTEK